jgi:hypothetical protein
MLPTEIMEYIHKGAIKGPQRALVFLGDAANRIRLRRESRFNVERAVKGNKKQGSQKEREK